MFADLHVPPLLPFDEIKKNLYIGSSIGSRSKAFFKALNALYAFKILDLDDIDHKVIMRKLIPLIESYIIDDFSEIRYGKDWIHFPRDYYFSLMINNPKKFFKKYFPDLYKCNPNSFHLCNIYQYVVGGIPRRISYYTIAKHLILDQDLNYNEFESFPAESLKSKNLKIDKEIERPYFTSPFDLYIKESSFRYGDKSIYGLLYVCCDNFVEGIAKEIYEKINIQVTDDIVRRLSYILVQILTENVPIVYLSLNRNRFKFELAKAMGKKDNKFINEKTIEMSLAPWNKLGIIYSSKEYIEPSETEAFSVLDIIYDILLFKDYFEYPTDEKILFLIDRAKRIHIVKAYHNLAKLLCATLVVDKVLGLKHFPIVLLFQEAIYDKQKR